MKWLLDQIAIGSDGYWTRWLLDEMAIRPDGNGTKWLLNQMGLDQLGLNKVAIGPNRFRQNSNLLERRVYAARKPTHYLQLSKTNN